MRNDVVNPDGTKAGELALQGIRLIAEKVVHHPTIIAGHAEGRGWIIDADTELRSKFWGRSIDLIPVGVLLTVTAYCCAQYAVWMKGVALCMGAYALTGVCFKRRALKETFRVPT